MKWRKVLYETGGFPDNYTPEECFLAARRYNQNLVTYSLGQCLVGGAEVTIRISLVIIVWSCYCFIKSANVKPSNVTLVTLVVSLIGYLLIVSRNKTKIIDNLHQAIKTSTLFIVTGYALSPVLYTLTDTISTDSIHSMAASSFLLHLLTADYGISAPVVSWQLSLNAAVFSSVCLASRFQDHQSAFALLSVSVFCFLLIPLSRHHIMSSSLAWSVITSTTCLVLQSMISRSHTILATVSLVSVQVLCPTLFYYLQSDKLTIHGPWDEATPASS